jgi:hypothetical protein
VGSGGPLPVNPRGRILEKLPVHDDTFGGAFEIQMEFSGDTIFLDTVVTTLTAVLHMEDELLTSITGDGRLVKPRAKQGARRSQERRAHPPHALRPHPHS